MSNTVLVSSCSKSEQASIQKKVERVVARACSNGDEIDGKPYECNNCPKCWEKEQKVKGRRISRRLAKQTTHWKNPTHITINPDISVENLAKVVGELLTSLKSKKLLCRPSYIRSIECGVNGKVHAHIAIDSAVDTATLRLKIDEWLSRRKHKVCTSHSGILVEKHSDTAELIRYVCKLSTPFCFKNRLPTKRIVTSNDLRLKPAPKKRFKIIYLSKNPGEEQPPRNPRNHAPRTFSDGAKCGKTVMLVTKKRDSNLVTSGEHLNEVSWQDFSTFFGRHNWGKSFGIFIKGLAQWLSQLNSSCPDDPDSVTIDDVHDCNSPDVPSLVLHPALVT